jgi:hypothetical protein
MNKVKPIERDAVERGCTIKHKTACTKLFITVNHNSNNEIFECFITPGKEGGCHACLSAIGALISLALRYNVPINDIIKQLKGIRCKACTMSLHNELEQIKQKNNGVLQKDFKSEIHFSCPDAISKALLFSHNKMKDNEKK